MGKINKYIFKKNGKLLFKLFGIYENVQFAYSIRHVVPDYQGYCMTVRRDSDDAELNIGFVNGELDTTTLLNFVGSSNGCVTTWFNQGIIDDPMINPNNINQPYIVENGVLNLKRGKPSIRVIRKGKWLYNNSLGYLDIHSSYNVFSQNTDAPINSGNTASSNTD